MTAAVSAASPSFASANSMVTLAEPEPTPEHQMVLVATVAVRADQRPNGLRRRLDDRDVAPGASVDELDLTGIRGCDRPVGGADDDGRRHIAKEEPGDRDVEGFADRVQAGQGRGCLVVLDLRQVTHVQAGSLSDVGQGEAALDSPATDLGAHGRRPACVDRHIRLQQNSIDNSITVR